MAATRSVVLTFEIFKGNQFLRREESTSESVTIGKGPAAMLRLEDAALHDLHLVLNVNDDGSVQLHDLAADNSTIVNGRVVDSNVVLAANDEIRIGAARIVVRIADTAAFADDEATKVDVAPVPSISLSKAPAAPVAAPAHPESAAGMHEDDDTLATEDVLAYVMRTSAAAGDAGADRSKGKLLEVSQVFGDSIMATKHFGKGQTIRVGSALSHTIKLVGVPISEVSDSVAMIWPFVTLAVGTADEHYKNPFYVPDEQLPRADFPLFESSGGVWYCNVNDKWTGFVDQGESRSDFKQLVAAGKAQKGGDGYRIEIAEDARLVLEMGTTIFVAHQVYPGKQTVIAVGENIDWMFLAMVGMAVFTMGAFMAVVQLVPPPEHTEVELDDRLIQMLLEKEKPPEEDKQPDAGEGAKAKKEEGKVGKEEAKLDKAKGEKVQKMQMDKEVAEDAGLLGALRDDASLDSSLSNSGLSGSLQSGIGGLIGAKGTQAGSGGLGGRGGGLGGGGSADGLGGMGTKGRGSGSSGYGSGGGDFGQRGEGAIAGVGGDPIILGALDKSLIDAVIKRNMSAIRYCYQRELTKNPSLNGKITVKFVIAADGSVSSATTKSSSMSNPAVESCINGRFMRFTFPQPKGGGIVIVSYPFIFSPG